LGLSFPNAGSARNPFEILTVGLFLEYKKQARMKKGTQLSKMIVYEALI
jgi:hypothetical protein